MSYRLSIGDPKALVGKVSVLLTAARDIESCETEDDAIDAVVLAVSDLGYANVMISLLREQEHKQVVCAVKAIGKEWEPIVGMTVRPYPGPDLLSKVLERGQPKFVSDSRTDPENDPQAIAVSGIVSQYVIPLMTQDMRIGTMQIHMEDSTVQPELECRMLDAIAAHLSIAIGRLRAVQRLHDADVQMLSYTRFAIANEVAASMLHQLKGEVGKFLTSIDNKLQQQHYRENAVVFQVLTSLQRQVRDWWQKIDTPLHFTRVEEKLQTCSANQIITDTIGFWYENAKSRKCNIKNNQPKHDVQVHIWPSHLRELLSCLIVNGLQAHARTIQITLDTSHECCGQAGEQLCAVMTVADDGDGIPTEIADKVFNLGFTTKPKEGTGMGLYIARRLASAMSGYLDLQSGGKSAGANETIFRLLVPAEE